MTDLPAFLLARIAEDEAVARAATRGPWSLDDTGVVEEIRSDANNWVIAGSQRWRDGAWDFTFENPEDARHAARWDPARVLAECEAKRRIVRELATTRKAADAFPGGSGRLAVTYGLDAMLRLLALPYSDHEDYREEWRP